MLLGSGPRAEEWSELLLELSLVGFIFFIIAGVGLLAEDRDRWSRPRDWWSRRFEPGLRRTILEYVLAIAMVAVIVGIFFAYVVLWGVLVDRPR